ncbi:MAG: FadR family transcriptional regulator [Paenibacillaceae bacterium]|nr:FadR family transcriptional regulator [Paenibacillaceae bacterium]
MLKKVQSTTTLYEQVVEQIKIMIAQGIYQKGDMLPSEKDLIEMTGVSRITVREALKSLAEVGIIETKKGKGSFVLVDSKALSPDKAAAEQQADYQKYFLNSTKARLILEPELARVAAERATEADILEIKNTLFVKQSVLATENQFDNFHYVIAKTAGNTVLLDFIKGLLELESQNESRNQAVLRLVTPEHQKRISAELNSQHKKIFNAIKNHDSEFAYFYMKEHMMYLLNSYEEYFERFFSKQV